jgi:hypothetical protein
MMNHEELDQNGELKFKTIGKMLDEKVDWKNCCIKNFMSQCNLNKSLRIEIYDR